MSAQVDLQGLWYPSLPLVWLILGTLTLASSFVHTHTDTFCPVSPQIAVDQIKDPQNVNLWLKVGHCALAPIPCAATDCSLSFDATRSQVDNQLRQKGNTKDMLFSIPTLISYISTVFRLEDGDCILTGAACRAWLSLCRLRLRGLCFPCLWVALPGHTAALLFRGLSCSVGV